MQIYQINRKIMPFSSAIQIEKDILKISARWKSQDKKPISQSYNLAEIIGRYSEDHGCIALCYTPRFKDELVWHETTRFTYGERISSDRSYSSMMQDGLSINDTPQKRGRHNAASPAAILKQRLDATPVLYLLTPARGCSVNNSIIVFHGVDPDPGIPEEFRTTHSLSVDGNIQAPPMMPSLKMFLESWLPIAIGGPDLIPADQTAKYLLTNMQGGEIYLEATGGILNRSRAKNGQQVLLDTRGLETGEEITIKAGYKFWPGISQKKIAII
jgi:hypothetical protein